MPPKKFYQNKKICFQCKQPGHLVRDCPDNQSSARQPPPNTQHLFDFDTQPLTTDTGKALVEIRQYARDITIQNNVIEANVEPTDDDINETQGDYGLRTEFSGLGKEMEIATNYLPINLLNDMSKVYVYEIEMVNRLNQKQEPHSAISHCQHSRA